MEPPKKEKTLEIAQRSRKNLEFIYTAKQQGEDVEEFTQLLNSLLSMLISLQEDYFKGSEISWKYVESLALRSWDKRLQIKGSLPFHASPLLKQVETFSDLMKNLRNAFAHSCFELLTDLELKQIIGVRVWNIPTRKKNIVSNRVWEAEIMEAELRGLAYLFVEYLEKELDT